MHVNSLITHLQLKKMLVMYESAQIVAITFKLLEMSSITTSNQTISNIRTRYIFSKSFFFRKNIGNLPICIMKKIKLEVLCKRKSFGYANSCKRLPNFVNMAALVPSTCILCENNVTDQADGSLCWRSQVFR